jgi:hypothetical protein
MEASKALELDVLTTFTVMRSCREAPSYCPLAVPARQMFRIFPRYRAGGYSLGGASLGCGLFHVFVQFIIEPTDGVQAKPDAPGKFSGLLKPVDVHAAKRNSFL